jgi:pimeloyl-ACP methyl ester carboxylesterase
MHPEPSEQFITVRNHRVRVLQMGTGPALLYLHGSGDTGAWLPALSELATSFRVIRPDHPGFNGSDEVSGIDNVHDLAFFTLDLLDKLELDRVSVLGASLGGWLALDLATIEPGRIDRIVVIGSAGLRVEGVPQPDVFTLSPSQIAELLFHDRDRQEEALAQARALDQDPAAMQAYLRNRVATAHLAWNPYFHDPKLLHRIHRITAPVLVVWGAEDRVIPSAHGERWAQLLSGARLEIVSEAGHLPHVERPARFTALVEPFLSAEVHA